MTAPEIVEPGRYEYDLKIQFPSVYIPDHTPPGFRNSAAYQTTRTRRIWNEFTLTQRLSHDAIRDHFVRQARDELIGTDVQVIDFTLTPVPSTA